MTARLFNTTAQQTIALEYQSGAGLRELARKYECDRDAISTALRYQGVDVRRVKNNNRYEFNIHAFDQLDERACYWLGFLYADGYISDNRSIVLALQRKDRGHLEKFKDFMRSNSPIKDGMNNIGDKQYPRSTFIITSTYFGKRFSQIGLNPRDPSTAFHSTPYKRHWIRGLFDGDGCVYTNPNKGVSFMGERLLMELLHNHFVDAGVDNNPTRKIQRHTKSNIYYLEYSGRNVAAKILDYLYQDATVWLERKRQMAASWPEPQQPSRNDRGQYYVQT